MIPKPTSTINNSGDEPAQYRGHAGINKRLIEQHRLETLAIHSGERERRKRKR
jgi:hypothetical protein